MRARTIADGIAVAVAAGLTEPEHIEEIGILNEGFGADRISDAALNVLKARFITYTQTIAARHDIALADREVRNAGVDLAAARWFDDVVQLPTNPVTGDPTLLLPRRLLRDLPTLNAEDWFQSDVNDEVRTYLNIKVGQSIPKREIVRLARRSPEQVREWARRQTTRTDLTGYDFGEDPRGVVNYDTATVEFTQAHPLPETTSPRNQAELSTLIGKVLGNFKTFIEQGGGWKLLWNSDRSEKNEDAAQLLHGHGTRVPTCVWPLRAGCPRAYGTAGVGAAWAAQGRGCLMSKPPGHVRISCDPGSPIDSAQTPVHSIHGAHLLREVLVRQRHHECVKREGLVWRHVPGVEGPGRVALHEPVVDSKSAIRQEEEPRRVAVIASEFPSLIGDLSPLTLEDPNF